MTTYYPYVASGENCWASDYSLWIARNALIDCVVRRDGTHSHESSLRLSNLKKCLARMSDLIVSHHPIFQSMVWGWTERLGQLRSHWMLHFVRTHRATPSHLKIYKQSYQVCRYWRTFFDMWYALLHAMQAPSTAGGNILATGHALRGLSDERTWIGTCHSLLTSFSSFPTGWFSRRVKTGESPKGFDLSFGLHTAVYFSLPHGQLQSDFRRSIMTYMIPPAKSVIDSQWFEPGHIRSHYKFDSLLLKGLWRIPYTDSLRWYHQGHVRDAWKLHYGA